MHAFKYTTDDWCVKGIEQWRVCVCDKQTTTQDTRMKRERRGQIQEMVGAKTRTRDTKQQARSVGTREEAEAASCLEAVENFSKGGAFVFGL